MKPLLPALVVLVPLLAAPATAQDNRTSGDPDAGFTRIMNEMVTETLECSAYYFIAAEGLSRGNEPAQDAVSKSEKFADELSFRAFAYAASISMKPEAVEIRYKWAVNDEMELIDKNLVNISILIDKYSKSCKQVYEDKLESRIRYWHERLFPDRPVIRPTREWLEAHPQSPN